ncbi:MAG TPA: hypothetical protein VFE86_06370 [Ilumatobacteraceae bacterium]|nr:hypothetical protein [Ilumatobacteraceae bacterium]
MNARPSKRIACIAAVVVAGAVVGVTGVNLVAADEPSNAPANRIHADLIVWAEGNHLSGLSPASLQPAASTFEYDASYSAAMQELAAWARSEGLSGLSPLSLRPVTAHGN